MNTSAAPTRASMNVGTPNSVPGGIGYIFDIIVVRLDISDQDAKQLVNKDPSMLVVDATFNREDLRITTSRINVVEFKSGKSFEFVENPSTLKDDLSQNKLKLKIKYGTKEIGMCALDWPDSFLNCLTDAACVGELTHVFVSEFKNCDTEKKCGTIEVIVRLQTKCAEWNDDDVCNQQEDTCKAAHKVIDPNDILFVVGEDNNPCSCAQVGIIPAIDSDNELHATCLDLSNFRAVNGQTVPNTDILNAVDPACCDRENIPNEYQKLIDTLMSQNKPSSCTKKPEQHPPPPCCSKKQPEQPQTHHNTCEGRRQLNFTSGSSSDTNMDMGPQRCYSDEGAFAGDSVINICHQDPAPELIEQVPIRPRCCPLCKENLSWLPKLAACPKCGFKPIPQIEERPYNDKLTADKILHDFLEKKSSCTEQPSIDSFSKGSDGKSNCRCTCKPNKICAHCRIKKLCSDVFQSSSHKKSDECGKCEGKPTDLYNVCKTESKDCRPFLTRVFSELKELYDIPDPKKKGLEVDVRCEKELNRDGGKDKAKKPNKQKNEKKSQQQKEDDLERKDFLVKNFRKNATTCQSKKSYNYRIVRKYPGTQIGHKTCINGFAGRKNVPPYMGWLWNVEATGMRAGWKPGAIRKPIKELMKYFLRDFPADTLRVSQYSYRRGGNDKEEELIQKPTLHICKKNGEYFITLRPLKDPESLRHCADPYLNMKPIQFKIIKNPLASEIRKLKQCLKEMGFNKCTCHKPIIYCYCRSFLDKKRLEYQCNKEARKRNLPPVSDSLVLSDTSESETEFDFGVTPPAGVIKPENLKKTNFVNTGTQYEENDWNFTPMYPKEPNKYMKLYNCAVGERFGKEFGPYGPSGFGPGASPTGGVYGACMRGGGKGGKGGRGGWSSGRGGKGGAAGGGGAGGGKGSGGGTIDMMRYLSKSKGPKLSPAQLAEKRKKRLRELSGVAPPLICMVDRRAKPFDPCRPCQLVPCCDSACLRDNRIC